jgi:glycosyltransferase involved in cell wall biosynthesis
MAWRDEWKVLLKSKRTRTLLKAEQPLVLRRLPAVDLPVVGIITLTHNRPKWFFNMAQNILKTDYPIEKLRWIVVDDSKATERVDEQILKFQQSNPAIRVEYISLTKELSVGAKRNRGCAAAIAAGAEVLMMMDDDDHYPKSSVEARATYISLLKVPCVYCARIQMYDCRKFISAMNVPPLNLGPAERVSEASLAFTRTFWEERPFPEVSMAEGEGFLVGREKATAEIVPEGVIVSFLHGANATSRRVPDTEEANGCHYGFNDEYFLWLCQRGEENPLPK